MQVYKYWIVVEFDRHGEKGNTYGAFISLASARADAEIRTEHNPDSRFVVFESVAEVKKAGVIWTDHDPLPF